MPGPLRSAAATLVLAAAPLPLPALVQGSGRDRVRAPKATAAPAGPVTPAAPAAPATAAPPATSAPPAAAAPPAQPPLGVTTTPAQTDPGSKPAAWAKGASRDRVISAAAAAARASAKRHAKAHAAGDPGDTITDFKFSPGTTTIHVGDTITWTNNGPSPHTATANDHSFDTGTLATGKSASHTFTQSGTFAYICTIHPFMHGTVVVLAAAKTSTTPSTTAPAAGSGTPASTPATAAAHGPTLPVTGLGVPKLLVLGLALLAFGWILRRSARASS